MFDPALKVLHDLFGYERFRDIWGQSKDSSESAYSDPEPGAGKWTDVTLALKNAK